GSQAPALDCHHFNLATGSAPSSSRIPVEQAPQQMTAGMGLRTATDAFQFQLIEQTLAAQHGNWAATARALEMDGANLHRLARRLGLKP
ncbi:MAG: nitric oxide reductase transcription regulator, partial [Aeromonas molluscorum]